MCSHHGAPEEDVRGCRSWAASPLLESSSYTVPGTLFIPDISDQPDQCEVVPLMTLWFQWLGTLHIQSVPL